jgi:DNA-binding NtrC family response regulator
VAVNGGRDLRKLVEAECSATARCFHRRRAAAPGLLRARGGRTLFLDEITEMPLELQTKLLRVLETCRMVRVGGSEEIAMDARVVTASNHPPEAVIRDRRLREDLFTGWRRLSSARRRCGSAG